MPRTTLKLVLAAALALWGSGCAGLFDNFRLEIPMNVEVLGTLPTSDVEVLVALPGIRRATLPALNAASP